MESNHLQKRNLPSIQDRNTLRLIKIIVYISISFTNSGLNISEKEKIVLPVSAQAEGNRLCPKGPSPECSHLLYKSYPVGFFKTDQVNRSL